MFSLDGVLLLLLAPPRAKVDRAWLGPAVLDTKAAEDPTKSAVARVKTETFMVIVIILFVFLFGCCKIVKISRSTSSPSSLFELSRSASLDAMHDDGIDTA